VSGQRAAIARRSLTTTREDGSRLRDDDLLRPPLIWDVDFATTAAGLRDDGFGAAAAHA
jgi:hypothetical protein